MRHTTLCVTQTQTLLEEEMLHLHVVFVFHGAAPDKYHSWERISENSIMSLFNWTFVFTISFQFCSRLEEKAISIQGNLGGGSLHGGFVPPVLYVIEWRVSSLAARSLLICWSH